MRKLEWAGVIIVGLVLGAIAKRVPLPSIVSVAAVYVAGVVIGTKRPASGWLAGPSTVTMVSSA